MGSVSIYVSPVQHEFSKKKTKTSSRVAKLKQCKLDARRQQWLSQVNANKALEIDNKLTSPDADDDDDDMHFSINGGNLNYSSSNTNAVDQQTCSGSSSCWSVTFSEEDDDCLDDWETMADALTSWTPYEHKVLEKPQPFQALEMPSTTMEIKKAKTLITRQAWSATDTLRPQSLPNLSNKISLARDSDHNDSQLTCCPICYDDLDVTDSSFQPCTCGFLLCLFCYTTIVETDSRCPGCRKHYI